MCLCVCVCVCVCVAGRGRLRSLARIFYPVLDINRSGFARISLFLLVIGHFIDFFLGGGGGAQSSQLPALYAYDAYDL